MSSLNKAIIIGRVGKDPEVKEFTNGNKVVNLSIATSEKWTDKSTNDKREKTEWHRVSIFNNGLAKVAEQYVKKGSQIYIEAQLQTRKWTDKNGAERYQTEVVLKQCRGELVLLGGKTDQDTTQQTISEEIPF